MSANDPKRTLALLRRVAICYALRTTGVVLGLLRDGRVRRRDLIKVIAGSAAAWPLVARAQQPERIRRIGVLMGAAETASSRGWLATFLRRLDELGWRESRNLLMQVQWWNDKSEQMRVWATELIARSPDVAVTYTNLALEVLKPIAGSVPIVFIGVGDPIGSGFVASLAHPGGNITGFASHDPSMGGKWLGGAQGDRAQHHPRPSDYAS